MILALFAFFAVQDGDAEADRDWGRGLRHHSEGAFEGYTLFAPLKSNGTFLIDMKGEVVHEWPGEQRPGNAVYLLEDGRLLRAGKLANDKFRGGGDGGRVQMYSWEGFLEWDMPFSNEEHMQHHDLEPLPNGNVLILAWESRTAEEAIAAGRDPDQVAETFWPDWILEVKPIPPDSYEPVWEWHAWDHLIQDFQPGAAHYGDVTAHPERIDINGEHRDEAPMNAEERERLKEMEAEMAALGYSGDDEEEEENQSEDAGGQGSRGRRRAGDWMHTNSIDYLAEHDLIVLSVRTFDEVWVIDHSTTTEEAASSTGGRFGRGGDLLYRWGNPRRYGQGTDADQRLFGQHDATWVVGDDGSLSLTAFNNGANRPGSGEPRSEVVEIRLPFDPERGFLREEGAAFGPKDFSWTYGSTEEQHFYCSFISGAQRLPNGNTLIIAGPEGRIFEVTPDGQSVWEYENPFSDEDSGEPLGPPGNMRPGGLFRAARIAPGYAGLEKLW